MRAARWAALLAIALCLAAGCEPEADLGPGEAANGDGEGDDAGLSEETPGPTAPLTGLPIGDGADVDELMARRVVAVNIDNAPEALPQAGPEHADVVFVSLVEGGLTRLTALLHSSLPERVGPVRSARAADAELLPSFDALLATSGASPPVLRRLRDAEVALREEAQPPAAWRRDPARRAPHNLFVDPAGLGDHAGEQASPAPPWPITADASGGGQAVDGVVLRYSSVSEAEWRRQGRRWVRVQGGQPHVAADGTPISAANVVVARVEARDSDRTDARGNPVVDIALTGSGDALVLRGGHAFEARWQREPGGHFTWLTPDGDALDLVPGQTWVELVPTRGSVQVVP